MTALPLSLTSGRPALPPGPRGVLRQTVAYFRDPLAFYHRARRRFGPHEYLSFGGGHRHCLGQAFAMNEAKLVLGTLLSRWELSLQDPQPPRTGRRNVTLVPEGGVPVRARRRATSLSVGA